MAFVLLLLGLLTSSFASVSCPSGWTNPTSSSYCFVKLSGSSLNWADANAYCSSRAANLGYTGSLASVRSQAEANFVFGTCGYGAPAWMGMYTVNNVEHTRSCCWWWAANGEPATWIETYGQGLWESTQPNGPNEDNCGQLQGSGLLTDKPCSFTYDSYCCELLVEPSQSPTSTTSISGSATSASTKTSSFSKSSVPSATTSTSGIPTSSVTTTPSISGSASSAPTETSTLSGSSAPSATASISGTPASSLTPSLSGSPLSTASSSFSTCPIASPVVHYVTVTVTASSPPCTAAPCAGAGFVCLSASKTPSHSRAASHTSVSTRTRTRTHTKSQMLTPSSTGSHRLPSSSATRVPSKSKSPAISASKTVRPS